MDAKKENKRSNQYVSEKTMIELSNKKIQQMLGDAKRHLEQVALDAKLAPGVKERFIKLALQRISLALTNEFNNGIKNLKQKTQAKQTAGNNGAHVSVSSPQTEIAPMDVVATRENQADNTGLMNAGKPGEQQKLDEQIKPYFQ